MTVKCSFYLQRQAIEIDLDVNQLAKLPKSINGPLMNFHKYKVDANVRVEILQSFLDFLTERNLAPMIDCDNYYEYYLLNEEFLIMSNYLSNPAFNSIKNISLLKNISLNDNNNKSSIEDDISNNINYYIDNYPNELISIPITSLYNIFNPFGKNHYNHEKVCRFILKAIGDSNDEKQQNELSILISHLDGSKLTSASFNECFSNKEKFFNFTPKIDFSFIDDFNQKLTQISIQSSKWQLMQMQLDSMNIIIHYLKSPDGETERVSIPFFQNVIPNGLFANCKSITKIEIPPNVISIGDNVFSGCSSLIEITFPNFMTSIGNNAFKDCVMLSQLEIPSSVTLIEKQAFNGCKSLKQIKLPHLLTDISPGLFQFCSSLENIELPSKISLINSDAFYQCTSLKQISIPDSVKSICYNAFYECSSLSQVTFPSSLTWIDHHAFYKCQALNSVNIPAKARINDAFESYTSLKTY